MRYKHLLSISVFTTLIGLLLMPGAWAAEPPKDKGLSISPARNYVKVDAGKQRNGSFSIANLTDKPITTTLSVKKFALASYSYNYSFSEPHDDWIKLGQTQVSLRPHQSQKINYSLTMPQNSPPGGYYYSIIVSTKLGAQSLGSDVQAASLLYVTVNGTLTKGSTVLQSSISHLAFGKSIPYNLTLKNTGNVHYFTYISGQLHGPLVGKTATPTTHLLLPDTSRKFSGAIASPLLPGIYRATYGYSTDNGFAAFKSQYVVFLPPWSIAAFLLLIAVAVKLYRRRQSSRSNKQP